MKNTLYCSKSKKIILCFSLFWLFGCLFGALIYYAFYVTNSTLPQSLVATMQAFFETSYSPQELIVVLVKSVKTEIVFILFSAAVSYMNVGVWTYTLAFIFRGILFGLGGSFIVNYFSFSCFLAIFIKQILITAVFLYYVSFLCSDWLTANKQMSSGKVSFLYIILCECGMSLLIQFLTFSFLKYILNTEWSFHEV